jgi:hypothetical protein
MLKTLAFAALGSAALLIAPAHAQQIPELEGGPGALRTTKPAPAPKAVSPPISKPVPRPATTNEPDVFKSALDKTRALQAQLSRQAEVQKAAETQLAREAETQKVEQARLERLDASYKSREADLMAREKRLSDREAQLVSQQAELIRQRDDLARQLADASKKQTQAAAREAEPRAPAQRPSEAPRRYNAAGVDRETAVEACALAGEEEARDRDFFSAEYETAPRVSLGRTTEVRGLMRLRDRRGSMVLNSLCEVDQNGETTNFVFTR